MRAVRRAMRPNSPYPNALLDTGAGNSDEAVAVVDAPEADADADADADAEAVAPKIAHDEPSSALSASWYFSKS